MHCKIHEDGLCSACTKLAQVQLKIQQCKDLLDELYVQEARAKSCLNEAHDPIIRRLPLELVSYIFTLCDPQQAEDQRSRNFQFDLAAVSNTWRTIVWSIPQLWIRVHIRLNTPDTYPQTELLALLLELPSTSHTSQVTYTLRAKREGLSPPRIATSNVEPAFGSMGSIGPSPPMPANNARERCAAWRTSASEPTNSL